MWKIKQFCDVGEDSAYGFGAVWAGAECTPKLSFDFSLSSFSVNMVWNNKRKINRNSINENFMKKTVADVLMQNETISSAARKYMIKRQTLQSRLETGPLGRAIGLRKCSEISIEVYLQTSLH